MWIKSIDEIEAEIAMTEIKPWVIVFTVVRR